MGALLYNVRGQRSAARGHAGIELRCSSKGWHPRAGTPSARTILMERFAPIPTLSLNKPPPGGSEIFADTVAGFGLNDDCPAIRSGLSRWNGGAGRMRRAYDITQPKRTKLHSQMITASQSQGPNQGREALMSASRRSRARGLDEANRADFQRARGFVSRCIRINDTVRRACPDRERGNGINLMARTFCKAIPTADAYKAHPAGHRGRLPIAALCRNRGRPRMRRPPAHKIPRPWEKQIGTTRQVRVPPEQFQSPEARNRH